MDKSLSYSKILTQVLRKASEAQPRLQKLKISSVCDSESGQFLIVVTGWNNNAWSDDILFHAWLKDGKVVIEHDHFEEGLTDGLIDAGINPEDIVTGLSLEQKSLIAG